MKKEIKEKILSRIPTGQMRPREIVKLFYRIIELLFQVSKQNDYAWEGTIVNAGNRLFVCDIESGIMSELDRLLPMGETGRLIWIKDDKDDKRKI